MSAASVIIAIARWLNILVGFALLGFGILGALLIVVIFSCQPAFKRNPVIYHLFAVTVCNIVQLLHSLLFRILAEGFFLPLYNHNDFWCRERAYVNSIATTCFIYFNCLAAFDQYVSSSHDASIRNRWSSISLARRSIAITILLAILVHIPNWFFHGVVNDVCKTTSRPFNIYDAYVVCPIFYGLIPFGIIIYFTRGTVQHLRSTTAGSQQIGTRLTKQIVRMVVLQLTILSISILPFNAEGAYTISTSHYEKSVLVRAIEKLIFEMTRLFFFFNNVCTFYIYVVVSSEVRRTLRRVIVFWRVVGRVKPMENGHHLQGSVATIGSQNTV